MLETWSKCLPDISGIPPSGYCRSAGKPSVLLRFRHPWRTTSIQCARSSYRPRSRSYSFEEVLRTRTLCVPYGWTRSRCIRSGAAFSHALALSASGASDSALLVARKSLEFAEAAGSGTPKGKLGIPEQPALRNRGPCGVARGPRQIHGLLVIGEGPEPQRGCGDQLWPYRTTSNAHTPWAWSTT